MTFEEFTADWREKEKAEGHDLKVTCICGQHDIDDGPLSEEELKNVYAILQGNEAKVLTLRDIGR